MAPSVFLTGVTGYIGGDFLALLNEKHPDWDITAMVRNSDKGAKVAQEYPKVKLVYGDLESAELLEEEASRADIVYQFANCDHEAGTSALIKGLQRSSKPQVFYIHTSGSGILTGETFEKKAFGEELPKVYDDWENIQEMWELPSTAMHRPVDKIVQGSFSNKIKAAIVCPPTIYGPGRGPDNQRSIQTPKSVEAMLRNKQGVTINSGKNVWHEVHVQDLSDLYLLLTDAAANGGDPAKWNEEGYYFAENGEFAWGDVHKKIAEVAHKKGYLNSADVSGVAPDDTKEKFFEGAHYYVGTNSRGKAKRAREVLGWKPHRETLLETIPALVDEEARALGLSQGHAAKVAA